MPDIMPQIKEVFEAAFGANLDSITINTTPEQVEGWDSLGHASLAAALEKHFNIKFDIDDLMAMENIRAIVDIINGKLD